MKNLLESFSPLERKVFPLLPATPKQIEGKTNLDSTSIMRALQFLEKKKVITIKTLTSKTIELGVNGVYYKKNGLPERKLLLAIDKHKVLSFEKAKENAQLSDNEFKAALGIVKRKNLVTIENGKLVLAISPEEISKKLPQELFLDELPLNEDKLSAEQKELVNELKTRKDIIEYTESSEVSVKLTELGTLLQHEKMDAELLEEVTPEIIKTWNKTKKFRRYDILAPVPKLYGGKEHFVEQAKEYARKVWLEMGFKEMEGPLVDTSFWVFDSLFTAQNHPVREMQDSFFIKGKHGKLPSKELVSKVKLAHEKGVGKSLGWNYTWSEEEAKKVVLRTHTTSLSAKTLASLTKKDFPSKHFAIGKAFRNETIDWSHGIEFFQTEGIVVDENVTLRHLLGYLTVFYRKMGFEKIRWRPSFFPYTEPSLEIDVFHAEKNIWFELGGAGILRPEVTIPLLGTSVPVLAWGQGLDRMIMDYYQIKDLREVYSNDLTTIRKKKIWMK